MVPASHDFLKQLEFFLYPPPPSKLISWRIPLLRDVHCCRVYGIAYSKIEIVPGTPRHGLRDYGTTVYQERYPNASLSSARIIKGRRSFLKMPLGSRAWLGQQLLCAAQSPSPPYLDIFGNPTSSRQRQLAAMAALKSSDQATPAIQAAN